MNRAEFQRLSDLRLQESKALLSAGFPEGAYYLAGYAVECALKACIAKRTKEYDFPPDRRQIERIYTHDLNASIDAAELSAELKDLIDRDPSMRLDWSTIKDWSEKSRYDQKTADEANALLEAIERGKGGFAAMGSPALVNLDIELGDKVVQALDEDGKAPNVALWAKLPEFEKWRLIIASDHLDQDSPRLGYSQVDAALRRVDIRFPGLPPLFLLPMKRPFVQALRDSFASSKDTYGMRLGNQMFGDEFLEDAFVYRIR